MHEIATTIARCAGYLADSVATVESIDCGERRAIHYGGQQRPLLRLFSMSYDASAVCGDHRLLLGVRS